MSHDEIEISFISDDDTGLNRKTSDSFYTNRNIADECISFLKNKIEFSTFDIILESSAGNGSFSDYFKDKYENKLKAIDIYPMKKYIEKADFLTYNTENFKGKILSIGNPPFGRQSSLAKKFIKKCCVFSNTIAFILPKSFKKESMQKCFPLYFHLVSEKELPKNSFCIEGKSHDVPCVFQVWIKKNKNRTLELKQDPQGYRFVKKDENPDFSIRRVGGTAGTLDINYNSKSIQSHYFIKLDDENLIDKFKEDYTKIVFETNNTVGPKSIGKNEFIRYINNVFV